MKHLFYVILGLLFVMAPCHAEEYLKENMSFLQARKIVLAHGWHPYKTHLTGKDGFPWAAIERKLLNRGMEEVSSCSLGETDCNFFYTRGKTCLQVETRGEQIKWMRVIDWKIVTCPIVVNGEQRNSQPT